MALALLVVHYPETNMPAIVESAPVDADGVTVEPESFFAAVQPHAAQVALYCPLEDIIE